MQSPSLFSVFSIVENLVGMNQADLLNRGLCETGCHRRRFYVFGNGFTSTQVEETSFEMSSLTTLTQADETILKICDVIK